MLLNFFLLASFANLANTTKKRRRRRRWSWSHSRRKRVGESKRTGKVERERRGKRRSWDLVWSGAEIYATNASRQIDWQTQTFRFRDQTLVVAMPQKTQQLQQQQQQRQQPTISRPTCVTLGTFLSSFFSFLLGECHKFAGVVKAVFQLTGKQVFGENCLSLSSD